MSNAAFKFPGGQVIDTSTPDSLSENAADWIGLASTHENAAVLAAEKRDFDTALQQLACAQEKLVHASRRYESARELLRAGK